LYLSATLHRDKYDKSRAYLKITTHYAEYIAAILHLFTTVEFIRGGDKCVPVHAIEAYKRTRGVTPFILKLESGWR
jgi:hypothetical protein